MMEPSEELGPFRSGGRMNINQNLDRLLAVRRPQIHREYRIDFHRQQILDRRFELHGNFYAGSFEALGPSFEDARLTARQRLFLAGEVLERIALIPLAASPRAARAGIGEKLRCFVHVEPQFLLEDAFVERVLETLQQLAPFDLQLVIELADEPLDARLASSPRLARSFFSSAYAISDAGAELAVCSHRCDNPALQRLLQAGLCRYVKLDVGAGLTADMQLLTLNDICDQMLAVMHERKVAFIASRVDTPGDELLARSLPFALLSGARYSPSERI